MGLPKLNTPIYTTTLPSNKRTIEYRPFLSKEEKIFMMAKEAKDFKDIISSVKKIIEVCTFNKISVHKWPTTDFEWMFLKLREKSVGEIIELQKRCINKVKHESEDGNAGGETECGGIVEFDINIPEEVTVPDIEEDTNKIQLDDKITLVMKWPSFDMLENIKNINEVDETSIISDMIEYVVEGDEVYDVSKESPEEIREFVESFTLAQKKKIDDFAQSTPQVECTKKWECKKCGASGEHTFKGLKDFFG